MSIGLGVTETYQALSQNLNQAEDTALLTVYAVKPFVIQRYSVMADASEGLLAANELRLRKTTRGGTTADITGTDLDVAENRARGVIVYKDMTSRITIEAGETLIVASKVAAGATSTGDIGLEVVPLPFSGGNIPSDAVAAA